MGEHEKHRERMRRRFCMEGLGAFAEHEVLELMDKKPPQVELVITGRGATEEMIRRADLVSEMKEIKHYYREGVLSRKGIEC